VALRILVVEDDKHIRRILEQLLTHEPTLAARSTEVVLAQDGKEGLEQLDKGPYDLIISDLLMPRIDGFAFTRELRKHKHGAKVPLIVTSAIYKDQSTINRLQTETGAIFFSKPFQVKEMLQAIRKLVGVAPRKPDGSIHVAATRPARPDVTPTGQRAEPMTAAAGSLADRPPPRLLLELFERRAAGLLILQRGKVKKDIAFVHGVPVSVTSNLRNETLGHFLIARGIIDESRHQQALERAQKSQERLGQAMVELGWLTDAELMKQLKAQMRAKITNVLRWKDGDWLFQPGVTPPASLQTPVETPRLVFAGLAKTAHVDEIAQTLATVRGRIVLTLRAERYREAFVHVFTDRGLVALQRRPLLEELLVVADPTPMLVQLDALLTCGMAEIEALGAEKREPQSRTDQTDPLALERLPIGAPPESRAAPTAHDRDLYDQLFGDEPSEVRVPAAAVAAAPLDLDADPDDISGVMQVPAPRARTSSPSLAPLVPRVESADVDKLRAEVLHSYLATQGRDHYQVLGVERAATAAQIATAYAERTRKFRLERFADVDLGPDYARVEELHQLWRTALETLSSKEQRAAYDAELTQKGAPSQAPMDADLLAQKAKTQLATGDTAGARELLERAIAAAPDQADYHALYGWTLFRAGPAQLDAAWAALRAAFEIDRDHVDAHDFAGRIAAAAGNDELALDHLTHVLDAAPTRTVALAAFELAATRVGDFRRLERQYRKLIHRLGESYSVERALVLWWQLAELYRTRLNEIASAKVAYEIAAKLAPDDPRPREAIAHLLAADPQSWEAAAQAMRESWRLGPDDPDPGRSLFTLHHDGERWDAAYAVAAALAVRGAGSESSNAFLKRHRPRFLVRAQQPLGDGTSWIDRIRHPDDDPDLTQLFARIFAVWQPPFDFAALGVKPDDALDAGMLPLSFGRVLAYCAHQLGVATPPVYRRSDFGSDAHVGAARPPILLAGPLALALGDTTALAFRLGRALAFLLPGRAAVGALPARQLKQTLLATLMLASPSLRVDDTDGEIARLRAQISAAAPSLPREVAPLCERLLAGSQSTLNLSRYARAIARTADRIGLVLCNDLSLAVRIVIAGGAPGAENDLIDFALGDAYLAARQSLGLAVAV
jgi:CheY-like chemotaxis protein/tetratricopeptide (TPR) repeat protein